MSGRRWALAWIGVIVIGLGTVTPGFAQSSDAAVVAARLEIERGLVQTLSFDFDPVAHALTTAVAVEGDVLTLELTQHSNRGDDFAVLVDRGTGVLDPVEAPPVHTYRGIVVGQPEFRVRASYRDGKMNALILGPTGSWAVQPTSDVLVAAPWAEHVSYSTDDVNLIGSCGNSGFATSIPGGGSTPAGPGPAAPGGGLVITDIALEADFEYYELCGSSVSETVLDMEDILNSVEAIYEAQTDIIYEISRVIVRTSGGLYDSTSASGRLNQFASVWTSPPESAIGRDVAHLFSGQTLSGGTLGVAILGGMCSFFTGYGLSVDKSPSSYAGRVAVPAHELGHNWNANHCDSLGECKIMCSQLGGCGPIDEFAPASVSSITSYRDTRFCLTPEPLPQPLPFVENWESLSIDGSRWTFQSGVGITSLAEGEPTYPYALVLNTAGSIVGNDDIRSARMLLAGTSEATLRFYERSSQVAGGGSLIVEYRDTAADWVELDSVVSSGVEPTQFTARTYSLPVDALHDNFRLRFRTEVDSPSERWFLDNISVTDGPPPPLDPPSIAFVSPNTGPLSGGTSITIHGAGFLPDAAVEVEEAMLQNPLYLDHFTLTGETPPASASGGADITITQGGSSGTLLDGFIYSDNSLSLSAEQAVPGGAVEVTAFATNDVDLAGYSLACSFEGTWVDVVSVEVDGTASEGADFIAPNSSNDAGDSWWTLGVVLDLAPPIDTVLTPGANEPIALIEYTVEASAAIGETVPLILQSGVGDPPVDLIFSIVGGSSSIPSTANGAIQVTDVGFIRGDGNRDGTVDIADPVANLGYLFQGFAASCLDAFDTNDDGTVDVADPVYNLTFQFSSGPEPPQPFPTAGIDPTPDGLGCDP